MEERFETFTILLAKINKAIRKIKARVMEEFDLKISHVSCIYYISVYKTLTATELCEICQEDKGAISRAILNLKEKGFIKNTDENNSRYRADLELTELGKTVADRISYNIRLYIGEASKGVDEHDRNIMYDCLSKIAFNIEKTL